MKADSRILPYCCHWRRLIDCSPWGGGWKQWWFNNRKMQVTLFELRLLIGCRPRPGNTPSLNSHFFFFLLRPVKTTIMAGFPLSAAIGCVDSCERSLGRSGGMRRQATLEEVSKIFIVSVLRSLTKPSPSIFVLLYRHSCPLSLHQTNVTTFSTADLLFPPLQT